MPDQPAGIQQRIADILREHGEGFTRADNLAEVLVSELGLIEERQHKHPFGHGDQQEIRFVTEWSDE